MSHVTKLNIEVSDLEALATACKELGLELRTNQKEFKYYASQTERCDAAIVIPENKEAYQIGLRKTNEGNYSMHWDSYSGGKGMVAKVGTNGGRLNDYYGAAVAESYWRNKGWRTQKRFDHENEQVLLTASR